MYELYEFCFLMLRISHLSTWVFVEICCNVPFLFCFFLCSFVFSCCALVAFSSFFIFFFLQVYVELLVDYLSLGSRKTQ